MADATFKNLKLVGLPLFNQGGALKKAQEIQAGLGLEPQENPFLKATDTFIDPREAEAQLRYELPAWQKNFTSDDYREFCWHAPTVRLYIARPTLASPEPGYQYPAWVMNALGGIRETIDPMIFCASKTIACTVIDLATSAGLLHRAQTEFKKRTGGGVGGSTWIAPQCDYDPPIRFRWPEYVTADNGDRRWSIPALPWEPNCAYVNIEEQ